MRGYLEYLSFESARSKRRIALLRHRLKRLAAMPPQPAEPPPTPQSAGPQLIRPRHLPERDVYASMGDSEATSSNRASRPTRSSGLQQHAGGGHGGQQLRDLDPHGGLAPGLGGPPDGGAEQRPGIGRHRDSLEEMHQWGGEYGPNPRWQTRWPRQPFAERAVLPRLAPRTRWARSDFADRWGRPRSWC